MKLLLLVWRPLVARCTSVFARWWHRLLLLEHDRWFEELGASKNSRHFSWGQAVFENSVSNSVRWSWVNSLTAGGGVPIALERASSVLIASEVIPGSACKLPTLRATRSVHCCADLLAAESAPSGVEIGTKYVLWCQTLCLEGCFKILLSEALFDEEADSQRQEQEKQAG